MKQPFETKQRILIVDDDNFIRTVFKDVLDRAGYEATLAFDGDSALHHLTTEPYDLILLDLVLPGRDGFATCREIRAVTGLQHVPILMMTSSAETDRIGMAFEAGATDFISKPVNLDLLVHRVRYLLRSAENLKRLARNTARLRNAQCVARLGCWEWNPATNVVQCSVETMRILGRDAERCEMQLCDFLEAFDTSDRSTVTEGLRGAAGGGSVFSADCRLLRPDGGFRIGRLQAYLDETDQCPPLLVNGTIQDLTEMQQVEDRLQILMEAVDFLPLGTGITISDVQGRIIYANSVEAQMHGYTQEELIGMPVSCLAPSNVAKSFPPSKIRKIGLWRRESVNMRKNGEIFPVHLSSIAVRNSQGRCIGVVTACEDISSRKASESRIEYLAYFDTLTGLPNRVTLQDRLPHDLSLAGREERQMALLFLDLDNFKDVNDTQGHDAGDAFLKEVSGRLLTCVRDSDTLIRLGGDEFVILLNSIKDHAGASAAAERVLQVFGEPFTISGQQFYSSASIGIAMYPDDGRDVESLLKSADAAMYHAKSNGKANYQFFSHDMNKKIMRRVALENSMRQGLERGEFQVHYHPQWNVMTGKVIGVEALLRWESPDFGSVPPSEFIPLAEATGLIFPLGELVLRTAFTQAKSWELQGYHSMKVAVNISGKQFAQPGFLHSIARILEETGVDPASTELEFTESVIMEKADRNIGTLRALKEMGVRLSIDDFGTGYSSLNYLKHFPIDGIKIDRSFITDVNSNADDAAITEAIISMAHSLNLDVIAEGVENSEQLQFLGERNCHEIQGFLLARPMSADDLMVYLMTRNAMSTKTPRLVQTRKPVRKQR